MLPLEEVICTEELDRRAPRARDYEAENRALASLLQEVARSPEKILQSVAKTAMQLSRAHSAAISILEAENGRQVFRWRAAAGEMSPYLGGTLPRENSPCGAVLNENRPLLMSRPQRHYPIPPEFASLVHEVLLIPFYAGGKGVGSLSVLSHDESRQFDREDERLMSSLGNFAGAAYQMLSTEERLGQSDIDLRQRVAELEHAYANLRDLSGRLVQLQDEERRRIARELHDGAGQLLTALGMNLSAIRKQCRGTAPAIETAAEDGARLVQQLAKEIRTTSYLLHPPLLDETGLGGALRWYAEGLTKRSGIAIGVEIDGELGRLPQNMELALFRIVQEGLTNVHRHSGSKSAAIKLGHDSQAINLEVKDQGCGIPATELRKGQTSGCGVGLRGMRERVRHFGGTLDIQSDGHGTTVSVRVPLPADVAEATKRVSGNQSEHGQARSAP